MQGTPRSSADYVVAVIGAAGVGKTTVIRKAFKNWGLHGPAVLAEDSGQRKGEAATVFQSGILLTDGMVPSTVSSYSAQVETGHPPKVRSVSIEVLEIDVQVLQQADGAVTWPKSLPNIDGVMLCYDAQRAASIVGLKVVLSTPVVQLKI